MKFSHCLLLLLFGLKLSQNTAQVTNTATMDTSSFDRKGKVSVEGYVDTYFSYDFNQPASGDKPYFVSSSEHNAIAVNLAYIDLKYNSENIRARVVPAFGTYMRSNYATEPAGARYLIEGNAGVKLSRKKEIWLDAGVLGSPYTNESAISKDHLVYTRSISSEFVPYYLGGAKVSAPLSKKISASILVLNGWQIIRETNTSKSLGTQVEFKLNPNLLFNWNTYTGYEKTSMNPGWGMRYFSDVFFIYKKGKFSSTGCFYTGLQERTDTAGRREMPQWWQVNLMFRYAFGPRFSLGSRVEYFSDPERAMVQPITAASGFEVWSLTLNPSVHISNNALLRLEARYFQGREDVFYHYRDGAVNNSLQLTGSLAVWF